MEGKLKQNPQFLPTLTALVTPPWHRMSTLPTLGDGEDALPDLLDTLSMLGASNQSSESDTVYECGGLSGHDMNVPSSVRLHPLQWVISHQPEADPKPNTNRVQGNDLADQAANEGRSLAPPPNVRIPTGEDRFFLMHEGRPKSK